MDAARSIEGDDSTARFLGMIGAGLVLVGLGSMAVPYVDAGRLPGRRRRGGTRALLLRSADGALVRVFGMGLTGFIEGDVPAFWQDTV